MFEIFNSVGNPVLVLREFAGWELPDTPRYNYMAAELDAPEYRDVQFEKDSIIHSFPQSGSKNEWVQNINLSGSIVIPKVTSTTAEILFKAFTLDRTGLTDGEPAITDNILALKVFSVADPVFIPIRIKNNLAFPGVGDKIRIGHSCTINWESVKSFNALSFGLSVWYTYSPSGLITGASFIGTADAEDTIIGGLTLEEYRTELKNYYYKFIYGVEFDDS